MVSIHIQKKDLWLLSAIMVFLVGVVYIIAYNPSGTGGNPAIMGHSADEVEGGWSDGSYCIFRNGGTCPAGFVNDEIALELGNHQHDMCPGDEVAGDSTFSGGGYCSVRIRMCCK